MILNRTPLSDLLAMFAIAAVLGGTLSAQHTRARWKLDEGAGQVATNSGRHPLDGTLGTTTGPDSGDPVWISGRFGGALYFGGNDRVVVPDHPALEPEVLTLEAWVGRNGSPGPYKYVASKGANANGGWSSYALYSGDSGGMRFYVATPNVYLSPWIPPAIVWNGQWHHVAGTFDGSTVRIYLDGQEYLSGTPCPSPTIAYDQPYGNFHIGTLGHPTNPYYFLGSIDDVRLWSRVLSPAEIALRALGLEVDAVPPLVTITTPQDGIVTGASSVVIEATVVEDSECSIVSYPAGVDQILPLGGGAIGPISFPLAEGLNTITLTATDEAGNVGGATVNVTRDSAPPVLTLFSPGDGAIVGSTPQTVQIEVWDASGADVNFHSEPVQTIPAATTTILTYAVDLTPGPNSFLATAVDPAGSLSSLSFSITLDLGSPTVSITSPEDGACFGPGAGLITIVANVLDAASTNVIATPPGTSVSLPAGGGTAQWNLDLVEGLTTILVTATDSAGNPGSAQANVRLDTTPPTASFISPADGSIVHESIDVEVGATDDGCGVAAVDFSVDGIFLAQAGVVPYVASLDTATLGDGYHTLEAQALDAVGNPSAMISRTIYVDNTAPTAIILSPLSGAYVSGSSQPFEVSVADTGSGVARAELTVGAGPPSVDASTTFDPPTGQATLTGSEDTTRWPDGPLVFGVRVFDAAGNEFNSSITAISDNTLPSKSLVSPVDGAVVSGVISILAISDDPALAIIELSVDGILLGASATSPFEVFLDTRTHLDGPMTVTARVWDLAGNVDSCSALVTVNNQTSFKIRPAALNLKSKGKARSVTAWLEGTVVSLLLPEASHVYELEVPGGPPVAATPGTLVAGDHDADLVPDLKIKFDRRDLIASIKAGIAAGILQPDSVVEIGLRVTPVGEPSGVVLATATLRVH